MVINVNLVSSAKVLTKAWWKDKTKTTDLYVNNDLLFVYCFVCHKLYKAKKGEATGLIRNGLPQLDN